MKFDIKTEERDWAFILNKQNNGNLFAIGGGNDIAIMKDNFRTQCYCKQSSFDYERKEKVFVGKEGKENRFTVKRIQVWQMYETEEQKNRRETEEI